MTFGAAEMHLFGQVCLSVMFACSVCMLIADLGGNWRRIWAALRKRPVTSIERARRRPIATLARKDPTNGR